MLTTSLNCAKYSFCAINTIKNIPLKKGSEILKRPIYLDSPAIIRDFLVYTETIKGKSSATADGYYRDLRTFFRFLKHRFGLVSSDTPIDEIDISDVTADLVKRVTLSDAYEFSIYCKSMRDNNEKTRARKISTIKSYFKYLTTRAKILDTNPLLELDSPKTKKSLPKYLTLEQSMQLLNAVDGPFKERNYCILTLFLNCGLRLAELCNLNISDVRDDHTMHVTGKGNKERVVYLNPACIESIKRYLEVRPEGLGNDKNALFLSKRYTRISRRMVEQLVEDFLQKSGLSGQGFSPHKLRHTAATLMYQHGNVDIRVLQAILGHENLGTTEIYTHLSNSQIEQASLSNPLANQKQKKGTTE